jgi:Putative peptidoglycan binding domain
MVDLVISHDILKLLAERASFAVPGDGLVFFGFRGLLPLDIGGTAFASRHDVRLVSFDHQRMRCTLGQWRPAEGKLALFPGSTVPHINAITAAKSNNGIGANMLMLGRYAYDRGIHKAGKPTGHRAFRQGIFFPVWRSNDDFDYDLIDRLDISGTVPDVYPWDNMHCAYSDNVDGKFSSNGCQVVAGRPTMPANGNLPESGPWKRFIENAYGSAANNQTRFPYMLFSGNEIGKLAANPDAPVTRLVRFGSQGTWVNKVQEALRQHGFPFLPVDGGFGRDTLEALMAFQNASFGPGQADGVVGPNTAIALGIEWPPVPRQAAAPQGTPQAAMPASVPADWKVAAVKITPGFEVQGDPYEGVSGNFDAMGISCGALQWNIGSNSLQPMLRAVGQAHIASIMPTFGAEMWQAANSSVSTGLGIVIGWQTGSGGSSRLKPIAKAELKALMGSRPMRAEQDKVIDKVAAIAFREAGKWAASGGRTAPKKREFCWFFDLVTQNGGLEGLTLPEVRAFIANAGAGADDFICDFLAAKTGPSGHVQDAHKNAALWRNTGDSVMIELLVASYLRSKTANPQWRHVVVNRKGTIAMGKGWVNSSLFDFSGLLQ